MNEEIKNYGKSIRTRLLNVAKQENIFFQTILTRYFQERLLYRMSQTHYKNNFYLKGGALMYAYERFSARPTLDIDFLGSTISNDGERIINAFKKYVQYLAMKTVYTLISLAFQHKTSRNSKIIMASD